MGGENAGAGRGFSGHAGGQALRSKRFPPPVQAAIVRVSIPAEAASRSSGTDWPPIRVESLR